MKQIIIGQKKAYATVAVAKGTDLTTVPEGTIALFSLKDYSLLSAKPTANFCIVCGRGDDKMPICFSEVDFKSLTVQKATYTAGVKFQCKFTIPTPVKGKDYTIVVVKTGTVFNERANWTFSCPALSTNSADVARELVRQINANNTILGVKASSVGGVVTIDGINEGANFEVKFADELSGLEADSITTGKKAILDKAYVQDLASRCAAEKGFEDTYRNGDTIYPGYPEPVDEDQYVMYTLRFAVPRVAAKQVDEVAYQIVHICVPVGSGAIANLDTIFGPFAETSDAPAKPSGPDITSL